MVENEVRQILMPLPTSELLDLLTGKAKIVNLPAGVRLVSSFFDFAQADREQHFPILTLRLEHPRFPVLLGTSRLPLVSPVIRKAK